MYGACCLGWYRWIAQGLSALTLGGWIRPGGKTSGIGRGLFWHNPFTVRSSVYFRGFDWQVPCSYSAPARPLLRIIIMIIVEFSGRHRQSPSVLGGEGQSLGTCTKDIVSWGLVDTHWSHVYLSSVRYTVPCRTNGTFGNFILVSCEQTHFIGYCAKMYLDGVRATNMSNRMGWSVTITVITITHLQLNFEQYKKTHIKFWLLIIIIIIIIFNYLRLLLLSLQAAFSVGASFSYNIILFAILRFATAASLTGFFVVQYVYILELVGPSFRTMSGKGSGFFWAIGSGASALLAYNIRYWRTLLLVASFPPLLFVVFYT